jgi:hypothetical protein
MLLPVGMAAVLLVPLILQAAEPLATLLVVPARQRMIQIAFDMQSLRRAEVVSWRATDNPETPELNYWDGKKWEPLSLNEFAKGSRLSRKPQKVIFIGLGTPTVLVELPNLPGIARFETYDPAVIINNLDAFYAFSPGEWRLLKKRYDFVLRDVNEKVRMQNRYANPPPPVETGPKRPPIRFEKNPPRAEVIAPKPAAGMEAAKPEPTSPAEVMKAKPEPVIPPVTIPAGTNTVPAGP